MALTARAPRAPTCTRSAAGCPAGRAPPESGRRAPRAAGRDRAGEPAPARLGRELDADGERRLLLPARRPRPNEDLPGHVRGEGAHDLADRGGKTLTPRTISMSSVRPMQRTRGPVRPQGHGVARTSDVVAGAEAQQRGGAVPQVREHELAGRAILELECGARLRVDQLGVHEPARAEVHAVLLLALAPERDADVADAHRLGDHSRPSPSSSFARKAGSPPPGSPATRSR